MVKSKKTDNGKNPYNKKELVEIREKLIEKKAQILQDNISLQGDSFKKSFKDASGDLSGYSFHMADMATDLYDREFSLELAEGERERLFALDEAIKRIDEGSYGQCDMCGVRITKQRMKFQPQAKRCIKCQEEEEKSNGR
ncbi:MAG: TraR/DksA family transcriptional regulator [Candidatus Tantalella remota]|nr:TraR/DksA family transcriptional regulator [Candidatus Tantalella remota]